MSPIRRSEFLGRPSLLVVHPVESAGGGERTIGFFVERPDLRELEAILATLPSDPPPAFWLIDGEGRVVDPAGAGRDRAGRRRPFRARCRRRARSRGPCGRRPSPGSARSSTACDG